MMRTIAVTLLFFSTFSCFVGCATTPEPKKVENKVVEKQVSEWQEMPYNPEFPGQKFLRNTRTEAIVSIIYDSLNVTVLEAINQEAERLFDKGVDTSNIVLSDNDKTGTFNFTFLIVGRPANGTITIMRVEPNLPLLKIIGIWPTEFDEEMTVQYKRITKEIVQKLKSEK